MRKFYLQKIVEIRQFYNVYIISVINNSVGISGNKIFYFTIASSTVDFLFIKSLGTIL